MSNTLVDNMCTWMIDLSLKRIFLQHVMKIFKSCIRIYIILCKFFIGFMSAFFITLYEIDTSFK